MRLRSGSVSLYAGTGGTGLTGNGGQATAATLGQPYGIWMDSTGNLFMAEYANNVIRKVSSSGIISTLIGDIKWVNG